MRRLLAGCCRQDTLSGFKEAVFECHTWIPCQELWQKLLVLVNLHLSHLLLSSFKAVLPRSSLHLMQKLMTWLSKCYWCVFNPRCSTCRSSHTTLLWKCDQAPCNPCWLSVSAWSKGCLFMFNWDDQLHALSILTLWKAHSPICCWKVQHAESVSNRVWTFHLTVAAHWPVCCQVTADFASFVLHRSTR